MIERRKQLTPNTFRLASFRSSEFAAKQEERRMFASKKETAHMRSWFEKFNLFS